MKSKNIHNIREYEDAIENEYMEWANNSYDICFRGQSNSEWALTSSLERSRASSSMMAYYRSIERFKPKINSFTDNKFIPFDLAANFDTNNFQTDYFNLPDASYLAYLRHHGFPTPILDWSNSKYVALFFACEDFASALNDGKVYMYFEHPSFGENEQGLKRVVTLPYHIEAKKRHFVQQSQYYAALEFNESKRQNLMLGKWSFIKFEDATSSLASLVIDREAKYKIMGQLREMGVTREALYLDEDSLVKGIADAFTYSEQAFERIMRSMRL